MNDRLCANCRQRKPQSEFERRDSLCMRCKLRGRKCPYCHRRLIELGRFGDGTIPDAPEWGHPGFLLPYGGPDRCASLVQHHDAGHRTYDVWATRDMAEVEYVAAIERLRRLEDVQWVLRKVGAMTSLPSRDDGLIPQPRPPFSYQRD